MSPSGVTPSVNRLDASPRPPEWQPSVLAVFRMKVRNRLNPAQQNGERVVKARIAITARTCDVLRLGAGGLAGCSSAKERARQRRQ